MAIKLKRSEQEEVEIYGNENFGIPKDCTKKQHFSTLKLLFYIVSVVVICIVGYKYYANAVDRFLPEITYDRTNQPLVYNTSSGIILKTQSGKTYTVSEEEDNTGITSASYGKSVFFISSSEENEKNNLCYYDLGIRDVTIIDKGVSDFKVDSDGKFVIYKKETELFLFNLKEKYTIADNAADYYLSDDERVITFFDDSERALYLYSIEKKSEPELIDDNITKIVSKKNDYLNIYYIKDSALYFKGQKSARELICEDVLDAIVLGGTVYYTTSEMYEMPLGDFFTDDALKTDEVLTLPDGADYINDVGGLSFFDEEAFLAANKEYDKKLMRDDIRRTFKEEPVMTEGISLYMFSDKRKVRVDTNLQTPYLSHNSCKNIMLYKKYDFLSEDAPNLSEIETLEEAISHKDRLLQQAPDVDMYIVKERKNPYLAFEDVLEMQKEISLDGKYLYCVANDIDLGKNVLKRYEIGATSLKNELIIATDVTDFALDGSDSSAVIVFTHNEISLFFEEQLQKLSENSCRSFFFVDGTLFYYDDYDHVKQRGNLYSVRNGKTSLIDTKVHDFKVRKYNAVSYIKNYKPESGTGTLYIKEGKTIKRQASYVKAIIN